MSESRSINQIEYRWQPGTDMTAIAHSMNSEWYQWWASRIGTWKRHPETDLPTESVWYETFKGSGSVALAWRQRDPRAVPVGADSSSRPEVSRVLMGPADVLTPRRAIALCAVGLGGLGEEAGPLPGTFMPGTQLPVITEEQLDRLTSAENVNKLDRAAAAAETDLKLLIAAALGDQDTPLAVELPERFIAQPLCESPQARLLWGLSRTLAPLLGPGFGNQRTWSFSTFEPPLGVTAPGALGAIVFRAAQVTQSTAPLAFRPERLVRLPNPDRPVAPTRASRMAEWLVRAYQSELGALEQQLEECARSFRKPQERVDAAYRMLEHRYGEQVPAGRPESVALSAGSRSSDLQTVRPRPAPPAERPPDRTPSAPRPPARLYQLVAALASGPESGTLASVLDVLGERETEYDPAARADTRNLLRERDWYVGSLGQDPRFHHLLVAIFTHAVLPDLDPPRAERQLSEWAAPGGAPEQVIRALYTAGGREHGELTRIMGPGLGSRWLAEKKISSAAPRRMQPRQVPSGQLGQGQVPPGQPGAGVGRRQDRPAPAGPGIGPSSVTSPFAPEPQQPLLSKQGLLRTLRQPVPLYVALALAIVVLILVLAV